MYWRPIRESDLLDCLQMQPACIGDGFVGRERALHLWKGLLSSPAFHANIIEADRPHGAQSIVGCGMGVFVQPQFVDEELAKPAPGLNSRIIASLASDNPIVLDRKAIASGNAGRGLDFVNLYGTWRDGVLEPDEVAEVKVLLGVSFVEAFAGYRFNRVLKEAVGKPQIEFARATVTYRLVAEFPECESALVVVTPESARSAPYSVATRMYRYQAPVLRLRLAEQALLAAALDGKTDAELSADLGLSIEAVKKRWLSIFARVEQFKPEIVSSTEADGTRRGPQKRHRVVAYIRNHLEELRPYAWDGD